MPAGCRSPKVWSLTSGLQAAPRREAQETNPRVPIRRILVTQPARSKKTPATPVFFSLNCDTEHMQAAMIARDNHSHDKRYNQVQRIQGAKL
jgi:hypothetical protein